MVPRISASRATRRTRGIVPTPIPFAFQNRDPMNIARLGRQIADPPHRCGWCARFDGFRQKDEAGGGVRNPLREFARYRLRLPEQHSNQGLIRLATSDALLQPPRYVSSTPRFRPADHGPAPSPAGTVQPSSDPKAQSSTRCPSALAPFFARHSAWREQSTNGSGVQKIIRRHRCLVTTRLASHALDRTGQKWAPSQRGQRNPAGHRRRNR